MISPFRKNIASEKVSKDRLDVKDGAIFLGYLSNNS